MAILNYTTKIDAAKTVGEIQSILGAKGAKSSSAQYEGREPVAIFFSIDIKGEPVNFRLPSNWQGVLAAIKRDRTVKQKMINDYKLHTPEQAKRVAWRIVKDWVEAQLAIIESGQAEMAQVFMPYAITANGQTCFERLSQNPQLLLGA